jgi:predicted metal-dependent HD superfamily phosphohydrolase
LKFLKETWETILQDRGDKALMPNVIISDRFKHVVAHITACLNKKAEANLKAHQPPAIAILNQSR